ncbi:MULTISPECIES: sugar phosphate isomerase/epimerase family protein [Thermus]|jgi:sugar phosphate isomerase/epimerase|nr:sugar phosphate isomerase/epimerase family protein [Thermus brockianus]
MDLRLALPVDQVLPKRAQVEALGVGLEVYLDPEHLEDDALFHRFAHTLGRAPSVHLPFWNLDLLSPDPEVRTLSLRRLLFGLERAAELGADRAVFHSGIPHGRTPEEARARAEGLVERLGPVVRRAQTLGIRLLLENTHEPHPEALRPVLAAYPEALGYCFDAAHARVFSRTPEPEAWLSLRPEHLHLNDTDGVYDRHWNLGEGILDHARWLPPYLDLPLVLEVRGHPQASLEFLARLHQGLDVSLTEGA